MKKYISYLFLMLPSLLLLSCSGNSEMHGDRADKLAHDFIIVDGHIDLHYQAIADSEDITPKNPKSNFDYAKAKHGGLNAPFVSISVPARYQKTTKAMDMADSLINDVQQFATNHSDKFAIATSPQEVQDQFKKGLVSLSMGLTNDIAIGNNLNNVQTLYDKGIRYISLLDTVNNPFSDPSQDSSAAQGGLSPFAKKLVLKMNKVGMMIDVSGLSDSTFFDVLKTSKAPVIASHSSCRYFTPGFNKNLSDSMLSKLAKNDGVMMLDFGSNFISDSSRTMTDSLQAHLKTWLKKNNARLSDPKARELVKQYRAQNYYYATISDVADHIDHAVNLAGIDHVGLGSNFNGVGNTLPTGLKNVSDYPNLIQELLDRGYTDNDIRKICYENIFRVWNKVAEVAQTLSTESK